MIGVAAGETAHRQGDLPGDYPAAHLAGKDAEFDVTVKSIEAPRRGRDRRRVRQVARPGVARQAARDGRRSSSSSEHAPASRQKVKRQLLDELDDMHKFDAAAERWSSRSSTTSGRQIVDDLRAPASAPSRTKTRPRRRPREEYRKIAERRVRLGLVLAEIGERNKIKVTDEELSRAVIERARQLPGPGAAGLGFLPQESRRAGEPARADLRGEGGRLHPRTRQGHRQDGVARRALRGRRGLTTRASRREPCARVRGTYLTNLSTCGANRRAPRHV